MPTVSVQPRYNNTQKYLLVADLVRSFFWMAVNCRFLLLLPLTGIRFLPGGIADFYIQVLVGSVLLELFDYATIFRKVSGRSGVRKPQLTSLVSTTLERLLVAAAILAYPRIARSNAFAGLVWAQSAGEMIRYYYNFYKTRTFARKNNTLSWIKRLSYSTLVPIEVGCEMLLLLDTLRFDSYYEQLTELDDRIHTATRAIVLLYLPMFYMVYKRKLCEYYYEPWVTRQKHVKEN